LVPFPFSFIAVVRFDRRRSIEESTRASVAGAALEIGTSFDETAAVDKVSVPSAFWES
jgi:hypothetical protein